MDERSRLLIGHLLLDEHVNARIDAEGTRRQDSRLTLQRHQKAAIRRVHNPDHINSIARKERGDKRGQQNMASFLDLEFEDGA